MIDIAFVVFLQVSTPAVAGAAPAAADEPKIVCSMEPVTGTRAKKHKVCKPVGGFAATSEEAKEVLRRIQGTGGNVQPTLPPAALSGPG